MDEDVAAVPELVDEAVAAEVPHRTTRCTSSECTCMCSPSTRSQHVGRVLLLEVLLDVGVAKEPHGVASSTCGMNAVHSNRPILLLSSTICPSPS